MRVQALMLTSDASTYTNTPRPAERDKGHWIGIAAIIIIRASS